MDTLKVVLIAGITSALIGIGAFFAFPSHQASVEQPVGALAGPDIPSNYLRWGSGYGVRYWPTSRALTTGTTTICSIQSPAATSTLSWAGIKFDVSTSSATILDIGKASTPYATTTLIGTTYNILAGAQAFVQASTSPAAGAAVVFAPSVYLNFKTQGGTTGGETASAANSSGYVPSGSCQAEFISYETH